MEIEAVTEKLQKLYALEMITGHGILLDLAPQKILTCSAAGQLNLIKVGRERAGIYCHCCNSHSPRLQQKTDFTMNTMTSAANLFCPVMNIGYQHDTESTSNKADPEK
ncbi:hypothetical protein CFP56_023233 [Quercus suber]|uniref:Uncharacterized protein n=1 Tax=Quercus suber TaxID=58331 RepID=A0AAW0K9L4_QUESU